MSDSFDAGQDSIRFTMDDFSLLELAVRTSPELRLAVFLTRAVEQSGVEYPVTSSESLKAAIPGGEFREHGHSIGPREVDLFFPPVFFPVIDRADMLKKVVATLHRCRLEEARVAAMDPAIFEHIRTRLGVMGGPSADGGLV